MIATAADAWQEIRRLFAQGWFIGSPPVVASPVQWPNQPFNPPIGKVWARLEVTAGDTFNAVVGITQVRSIGIIWIGIYYPVGKGLSEALIYAELAATIFRNKSFSGIRCKAAEIKDTGVSEGWRLITVTTPFLYDLFYEDESP